MDWAGLRLFRPYPTQKQVLESTATSRLVIGNERAAKSLVAGVDSCLFVAGIHPYSQTHKPPVKLSILVDDFGRISRVIYPMLFEPGAFKLPDGSPAPPLIPEEAVASMEWVQGGGKRGKRFTRCNLKSGSTITTVSAKQGRKGVQGDAPHRGWQDEALDENGDILYLGILRGLSTHGGMFIVSCCGLAREVHLVDLYDKAGVMFRRGQPAIPEGTDTSVAVFFLALDDNPAIQDKEGYKRAVLYSRPDEYDLRVGEGALFLFSQGLVYKGFNPLVHIVDQHEPPEDCTLYESIDPGFDEPCAVAFFYVRSNGSYCAYDGIYESGLSDKELIEKIYAKRKEHGYKEPYACWIDPHSNKREMTCPEGLVSRLRTRGLDVHEADQHCKDPDGVQACAADLESKAFTVTRNCVDFIQEFSRYSRKENGDIRARKHDHLMDAWRNAKMSGLYYRQEAKREPMQEPRIFQREDGTWMIPAACIPGWNVKPVERQTQEHAWLRS